MDPLLYAILVLSGAGALLLLGGWIVSRRNR
jgi:LPXTG-motif cell wall-anchored protein